MSMVCPQCEQVFEQQFFCRECGTKLHYHAPTLLREATDPEQTGDWQHTPWGKVAIGVLLAQGLSFGLHHLLTAGLLATAETGGNDVWGTLGGLLVLNA